MDADITVKKLTDLFKENITELQDEPEFQWKREGIKYAVDEKGEPCLKLTIGNVALDYDLWEGLRNPALVGLYPVGLREIWEFFANRRNTGIDESGRQTIFQIPRSYDFARKNYTRALIISVMLPFSLKTIESYTELFLKEKAGSSHIFARMYEDVNLIIDKATMRIAANLVADDRVVVGMDNDTVKAISKESVPSTRRGTSHGPCKGGNYSQKSIAVLMGPGQFGVSRIVFRDEITNGKVERFSGLLRSIVIFDKKKLVKDGKEMILLNQNTFTMQSALGSEFNTELKLTYHIDPVTGRFSYHDSKVTQGPIELDFAIYIEGNTARFTSTMSDGRNNHCTSTRGDTGKHGILSSSEKRFY